MEKEGGPWREKEGGLEVQEWPLERRFRYEAKNWYIEGGPWRKKKGTHGKKRGGPGEKKREGWRSRNGP